jgi:hypothetical protein
MKTLKGVEINLTPTEAKVILIRLYGKEVADDLLEAYRGEDRIHIRSWLQRLAYIASRA